MKETKGQETKDRLLKAYFEEGVSVSSLENLSSIAEEIGLSAEETNNAFTNTLFADKVKTDIHEAQTLGISGVPEAMPVVREAMFDPEPSVDYEAEAVKDYASLYPSCDIQKNMSHETIVLNDKYDNLPVNIVDLNKMKIIKYIAETDLSFKEGFKLGGDGNDKMVPYNDDDTEVPKGKSLSTVPARDRRTN